MMAEKIVQGGDWLGIINRFMSSNEITDTGWQTGGITLSDCVVANNNANSVPKYRLVKMGPSKLLFIQFSLALHSASAKVILPKEITANTADVYTTFVGSHGIEWVLSGNVLSIVGDWFDLDLANNQFASLYSSILM